MKLHYSPLVPILVFLVFATSGCINTSSTTTAPTPAPTTTETITTTTTITSTTSESPLKVDFNQATTYKVTAGSLIPVSLAIYNYLPVDISQNSVFLYIENIFCPSAIPTGEEYLSKVYRLPANSQNKESIANILVIDSDIIKGVYQEFTVTNPGVLSGISFKINTYYLGTTKLTIPLYFTAPVSALFEYTVCTAVSDVTYQDTVKNCQVGYSSLTGNTPSDITPKIEIESQYGGYRIYLSFEKKDNVASVGYGTGQVEALVYKVYMNQRDITQCCKPEYGLSKAFDIGGFKLVFSDPYIENSGPFKERIVCELSVKNDQLYCGDAAIPGTDTKYGTLAFLDIIVGYPFKQNFATLDVNVILTSTATLKSCPTTDQAAIKTINYAPILDNPYAMAAVISLEEITLAYGIGSDWKTLATNLASDGTKSYALFFAADDELDGDYHTYLLEVYYDTTTNSWKMNVYGQSGTILQETTLSTSDDKPTNLDLGNLSLAVYVDEYTATLYGEVDDVKTIRGVGYGLLIWKGLAQ